MSENIVVKAEINEDNEEVLLFYVDDDAVQCGVVATENEEEEQTTTNVTHIQDREIIAYNPTQHGGIKYELCHVNDTNNLKLGHNLKDLIYVENENESITANTSSDYLFQDNAMTEEWTDNEIRKLLTFYTDNRRNFLDANTANTYLWQIACKTMITAKDVSLCEAKVEEIKRKYIELCLEQRKGSKISWPYYQMCQKAFYEDPVVKSQLKNNTFVQPVSNKYSDVSKSKDMSQKRQPGRVIFDANAFQMFNLYLKHKIRLKNQNVLPKELWKIVAVERGKDDAEFWNKKFINFKQHYIRLLEKRDQLGASSIQWPYMDIFDKIFEDDEMFQMKYRNKEEEPAAIKPNNQTVVTIKPGPMEWDQIETTVLVKYHFDHQNEFLDPTIPNNFLWNEVGRMLGKSLEECKNTYIKLKKNHMKCIEEPDYCLKERTPLQILFDCIISKEIDNKYKPDVPKIESYWETEKIDDLVQFLYNNVDMFKDPISNNIFWLRLSKKLKKNIPSCRNQWNNLKTLYKTILNEKKENSDTEIDWRYIEQFDRIFDYGTDLSLLDDDFNKPVICENDSPDVKSNYGMEKNIQDKRIPTRITLKNSDNGNTRLKKIDDLGSTLSISRKKNGEVKAFKILNFYHKNKMAFRSQKIKHTDLWKKIGKEVGMTSDQCAHRFRNIKQVYRNYLKKEFCRPGESITWPYFETCKKVFGYESMLRSLNLKLETNGMGTADLDEEWQNDEAEKLLDYCKDNFTEISKDYNEGLWTDFAKSLRKTEIGCYKKLIELKRMYIHLRSLVEKDPNMIISWEFYKQFEEIYEYHKDSFNIDLTYDFVNDEVMEEFQYEDNEVHEEIENTQNEDDMECIVVMENGQEVQLEENRMDLEDIVN